jgi:hypothetical protein
MLYKKTVEDVVVRSFFFARVIDTCDDLYRCILHPMEKVKLTYGLPLGFLPDPKLIGIKVISLHLLRQKSANSLTADVLLGEH